MKKIVLGSFLALVFMLSFAGNSPEALAQAAKAPAAKPEEKKVEEVKPEAAKPQGGTSALSVSRLAICLSIDNREPVGATESFSAATQQVFAFVELADVAEETKINVVWSLEGKELSKVELPVKASKKFRTNAGKNLRGLKGNWKVEVRDAQGNVAKDLAFKVE